MFDRTSLPRVLPFFVYLFFIFIADMLGRLGWTADQLRSLYGIKIGAVLAVLLYYRREYSELAWPPAAAFNARALALAAATGLLVLVLWVNLNAGWMSVGQSEGFDPTDAAGAIDWPLVVLRIAGAALVVPVMEELFWRSFLLRWITSADFLNVNPARVKVLAFVVTVILFGFEHNLWLAGMVAGAAYTILYMRSGTLWSPIVSHSVTNGMLGIWIIATGQWTYW